MRGRVGQVEMALFCRVSRGRVPQGVVPETCPSTEDCTLSSRLRSQELAGTVGQRSGKELPSPLLFWAPACHFLTKWTSAVWPRSGCSDSQAGKGEEGGGWGDASAESVGPSSEPS